MVWAAETCRAVMLSLAAQVVHGAFHQHLDALPAGWKKAEVQTSDASKTPFTLVLAMQNIDQLESALLSVSDPTSASYGMFLSAEEVQAKYAPSANAVDSVTTWLKAKGISNFQVDGAFIDFAVDLPTANKIFNASYEYYSSRGVTKLRTLSYSIPDDIQAHIVYLDPSTYIGNTALSKSEAHIPTERAQIEPAVVPRANASCSTGITPLCLKELYNIGNYTPTVDSGSRIGFGSWLQESSMQSDTALFQDKYGIPLRNVSKVVIAGGIDNQDPEIGYYSEANMDAQIIIGLSGRLPVTEFITGGSPAFIPDIDNIHNDNEPYVPFLRHLLSQPNSDIPQVISISYGDFEDTVPLDYAILTCNLIGLQGLRGITLLAASGDNGLGAGCVAPDNKTVEFNTLFPATCPYITAVGGTVKLSPETTWPGSGGGFSKYFGRPKYQADTVGSYLKKVDPKTIAYYGQYANFSGRGYPDVAAHSDSPAFMGFYNGYLLAKGAGTSASTPVWAGVVALLNDARLRAGKSTLGFLNPLLYSIGAKALTDITDGYSIGCNGINYQRGGAEPAGAGIVAGARWNATQGWDPVTGGGTPDFDKLRELVLSL